MEAIAQDTAKMSGDLEIIKIQNEIARLDREWERERQPFMVDVDGRLQEPNLNVLSTWMFPILFGAVGLSLIVLTEFHPLSLIGATVFGLCGRYGYRYNRWYNISYVRRKLRYKNRRAELLRALGSR